jgi:tetratricopeptide (TPR) repeat protein
MRVQSVCRRAWPAALRGIIRKKFQDRRDAVGEQEEIVMKFIASSATALVASLIAAPASAQMGGSYGPSSSPPQQTAAQPDQGQEQGGAKVNVSNKARKAISELQTAVNAKDFANIPAKVAAAQAVAQTKDDRYAIGLLQRQAAVAANDNALLATSVETIASSNFLDATTVGQLYQDLGIKQFNAKQFPQAVASFQRAASLAPNDTRALELVAEAMAAAGQKAEAAAAFQRVFQAQLAAGQKPTDELYRRAVQAAYDGKSPSAVELARQWVAAHPSTDSWRNSLVIYRNLGGIDQSQALDIMRLARATNSMQGTADYNIYTAETINVQNYGEARAVLEEGLAAGKIKASDPVVQDIQNALKGKASPSAAELASREATAKVPNAFMRVGDAYYGAGNYQKAAEMYRAALEKGADANLANLRLGEALARAGDKAGAAAALGKVSGSLAELAKFWLIYAQRQG